MNEVVYFMHVPWGWIKQRPHFLAEHLCRYFSVHVYYLHHLTKPHEGVDNRSDTIAPHRLFVFPSRHVNNVTIPFQLRLRMKNSRYVWLTHPSLLRFVAQNLTKEHIVIYDCMDDAVEFPMEAGNRVLYENVLLAEKQLCTRADIIFASSEYLGGKLVDRFNLTKPVTVVNNGIQLYKDPKGTFDDLSPEIKKALSSSRVKITYIGTVAEWMDFDLILESLQRFDTIEYLIFGHKDTEIPVHDRIRFFGPIKHELVFPVMANSDVLTMPFILNELILSVDPVKVYEYIFSVKPSLVRRYAETEKFSDYVYLYDSIKEYCTILEELINNGLRGKAGNAACSQYVKNNTWEMRTLEIIDTLKAGG